MKILIVSATQFELKPLLDFLEVQHPKNGIYYDKKFEHDDVHIFITGIGMVNTAFNMGRYISNKYDLVLNVGICGAFNRNLELGQIVHVTEDILSELGAEDGDEFLTYDKLNLDGSYIYNNHLTISNPLINGLKKVRGITVNTIHGSESSITKIKHLYNPDVESMEGASFYASSEGLGENFTQIRAVSNYVERRDKTKWNMTLAIKNLNDVIILLLKDIIR